MYIAGLYLSHAQGIESMVCLTTVAQIVIAARQHRAAVKRADSEGGSIVKLPESLAGRIVTPIHAAAIAVPTLVYVGSVIVNGLVQPSWIERWRLPEVGVKEEAWARTAACVAALGVSKFMGTAYNYLGKQFHYIGVREKPTIVSTGPYAIIRHPLYSAILAQEVICAVMFWSYVPFIALGITAATFAVKIPIEEKVILDSPNIGLDYEQYQKKSPPELFRISGSFYNNIV